MADNRVEFELAMKDMATKELQRFRGELDKLAAQSKGAFDGVRTSSVNSTQAMINMGRVMSDLPYGFTAIANNIDPLVMSLGMGAGLGFAITGVTTAMQFLIRTSPDLVNSIFQIDQAAENASKKGLASFEEKLRGLIQNKDTSPEQLLEIFTNIDKAIKKNNDTLNSYYEIVEKETPKGTMAVRQLKDGFKDKADAIRLANDRLKDYKDKFKDTVQDALAMKEVEKLFYQIGVQTKITHGYVSTLNGEYLKMSDTISKIKVPEVFIPSRIRDANTELKATFTQAEITAMEFLYRFDSGFQAVSRAAGDHLYAAFERSFKGANSLFEIFMANVVASMAELAAKKAAVAIFSTIANIIVPGSGSLIDALAFHNGGTVPKAHNGAMINAPASREFPILVRGGETIRTEGQERDLQNRMGKSFNVNINVNGNGLLPDDVRRAVVMGMRESGLTVDKYFVNNRSKVTLSAT